MRERQKSDESKKDIIEEDKWVREEERRGHARSKKRKWEDEENGWERERGKIRKNIYLILMLINKA